MIAFVAVATALLRTTKRPNRPDSASMIGYLRGVGCCRFDTFTDIPSALGQKRTYAAQQVMSALPPIATAKANFRKGPCPRVCRCAEEPQPKTRYHTTAVDWDVAAKEAHACWPAQEKASFCKKEVHARDGGGKIRQLKAGGETRGSGSMSALGQKRTFALQWVMSALPPKADM